MKVKINILLIYKIIGIITIITIKMEKYLSQKTLSTFTNAIGKNSLSYFFKSKTFFSSLLYSKNSDPKIYSNGNLILKNWSDTFLEDWIVYLTIRSHCETLITTGKIIRNEKELKTYNNFLFYGNNDLENFFYRKNSELKNFQRNCFVLSNNLTADDILTNGFFKEKHFKKFVMMNEKLKNEIKLNLKNLNKFVEENQIYFQETKINSIQECIFFLRDKLNINENILIEAGTNTMRKLFVEKNDLKNPIDFFVLSVYRGEINDKSLGDEFISYEDIIKSGLVLINVSHKIYSEKGYLTFYTFVNKRLI